VEHLTLIVGKESVALALIRHFGSLKALARASFQETTAIPSRRKAEAVIAALSMSAIAETEHARSEQLDNPESICRASADMKLFNQEVLHVVLLVPASATSRQLKSPKEASTSLWLILATSFAPGCEE
jgi:DNA repair protein RadC